MKSEVYEILEEIKDGSILSNDRLFDYPDLYEKYKRDKEGHVTDRIIEYNKNKLIFPKKEGYY